MGAYQNQLLGKLLLAKAFAIKALDTLQEEPIETASPKTVLEGYFKDAKQYLLLLLYGTLKNGVFRTHFTLRFY